MLQQSNISTDLAQLQKKENISKSRRPLFILSATTVLTIIAVNEISKRSSLNSLPDSFLYSPAKDRIYDELDMNYLISKDVFYFWCGPRRNFEFRHYLSVLSVFAHLKPYRVTLFYENEPINEQLSHDTWLQELRQKYPFFGTNKMPAEWCENADRFVKKYLAKHGGIFVNEEVILAGGFPDERYRNFHQLSVIEDGTDINLLRMASRRRSCDESNANCSHSTRPVAFSKISWKLGDPENTRKQSGTIEMKACNQPIDPNFSVSAEMLIVVDKPLFPEQIWELDSETGSKLRTVAYGKPELARPLPDFSRLAPNIAHVVWTNKDPMGFPFYLCVLSLLDVARFDKVYLHGDGPPIGVYWDLIKEHPRLRLVKRTVIKGKYERIYGTRVKARAHVVDVLRLDILNRYGGLYVDTDAIFYRPLTRNLLAYDAVVSPDVAPRGGFPDTYQNGIMLGKPGAKFWSLMLESNRRYNDDDWLWNCCVNLYRTKERHPATVLAEPRLNTICNRSKCHPTWERRLLNSTEKEIDKVMRNWRNNTFALHHTYPDLPEFSDHKALLINNGSTLFGEVGLYVLKQAGKLEFFNKLK